MTSLEKYIGQAVSQVPTMRYCRFCGMSEVKSYRRKCPVCGDPYTLTPTRGQKAQQLAAKQAAERQWEHKERKRKAEVRAKSMSDIVPYKAPPPPIRKELLKKNELTLRDKLWVWNDVVTFSIGSCITTAGLAWALVLWPPILGWIVFGLGALAAVAGVALFFHRTVAGADQYAINSAINMDDGPSKPLNHEQRAKLVLYDKNRKARPFRKDFQFANNRYSVWPEVSDFGDSRGLQYRFLMLEHIRPAPGILRIILPRFIRPEPRVWYVRIPPGQEANVGMALDTPREQLQAKFEELEQKAATLEGGPHHQKVKKYEAEEVMLDLRRKAPTARQEVIQQVRKQLNKGGS